MDGTSKDSSLLIYPFARRTPPSCCVRAHPLAGGPPAAAAGRAEPLGGSSSLLPSLRPGKPRRRKAARKEAAGEQWGAPGAEAAPAALPPAPPPPPPPGPAPAASCGLARRSAGERGPPPAGCRPALLPGRRDPSTLPTAAGPEPAPLTGDPRSPLKSPRQACQFSAALPRAPADLLAQPLTPKLSRPTARSGAARLARRQPRSRAYPGSAVRAGRPMGALSPPPAAPDLLPPAPRPPVPSHGVSTTSRRGGSTTDAPRPGRCSARFLPSGDGAAHKRRLSIVLLPDPQIPFSPPQKPPGEGNGKDRQGGRRKAGRGRPPAAPAASQAASPSLPFPKLALVARRRACGPPSKPTCPRQPSRAGPELSRRRRALPPSA